MPVAELETLPESPAISESRAWAEAMWEEILELWRVAPVKFVSEAEYAAMVRARARRHRVQRAAHFRRVAR